MTASGALSHKKGEKGETHGGTRFRFIAAPFTPKDAEGKVLFEKIEGMARYLISRGVAGVFVGGTTGEGMSLTLEERKKLVEKWKEACGGGLELIVHVGHNCLEDARVLAQHARCVQVDAIAAIGPCFFSANDPQVLAEYCLEIAGAAPGMPFYYYHMPSMARVGCRASQAFVAMQKIIPGFRGIKFTHEDVEDYRRCLELAGERYEIFFGRDELFLEALKAGARSAVGSTYNFATPLYHRIAAAFATGDGEAAQSLQNLASDAIRVMSEAGGLPAIQGGMKLAGFDCGSMRLPLCVLDEAQCRKLRADLEGLGYFDAIRV